MTKGPYFVVVKGTNQRWAIGKDLTPKIYDTEEIAQTAIDVNRENRIRMKQPTRVEFEAIFATEYNRKYAKLMESRRTEIMAENADGILRDIRGQVKTRQMEIGATIMIEALKSDRLIPDEIDKVKAASEAIRRHSDPMSKQTFIGDMRRD